LVLAPLGRRIHLSINSTNRQIVLYNKSLKLNCNIHQKTNSAGKCKFRKNLQQILLAVNFNLPHYEHIPELRKFYKQIFAKVVFCGQVANKDFNVIKLSGTNGFEGYQCLTKAIELYPDDYEGYLQINDDVILNFWNLNEFDPTKVWLGQNISLDMAQEIGKPPRTDWEWWHREGFPKADEQCAKAFNKLNIMANETSDKDINLKYNLKRRLEIYAQNTGPRKLCLNGWSDVFYISKQHSQAYMFISKIFEEHKVFLEVAVPTILFMLAPTNEQEDMNGVYYLSMFGQMGPRFLHGPLKRTPDYLNGVNFFKSFSWNITFSHPFKLSDPRLSKFFELAYKPLAFRKMKECDQGLS